MFNKKAGFNFETQMFENKVVVTESQIAGTSWGQDGLDAGHEYRVMSWNETVDTALVVRVVDIGSEGKLDFATIQIFILSQKPLGTDLYIAPFMALKPGVNSNLLGRIKEAMIFAIDTLFAHCGDGVT